MDSLIDYNKEQIVIDEERIRIRKRIVCERNGANNPAVLKDLNMDLLMLEQRIRGFSVLGQLYN